MYPEMSIEIFLNELGSKSPTPGGGGASAICGGIGAALCSMVGNLTAGKKRYAIYEEDLARIIESADGLTMQLAALADADAAAFSPLAAAYSLPNETDEEKQKKAEILESALVVATEVPLRIMALASECIELHEEIMGKCSKLAISDVGVGVMMCRSALLGASLNVYINTKLMTDTDTAADFNRKADALIDEYVPRADNVFSAVLSGLRQ